jgi:divalent metal cation (Fe/Co/Zn/Cd) transporter
MTERDEGHRLRRSTERALATILVKGWTALVAVTGASRSEGLSWPETISRPAGKVRSASASMLPGMSGAQADRFRLTTLALRLSWLSVVWAVLSGAASLVIGVLDHSLAIIGVGLNLLGDLAGSLVLIWRFWHERNRLHGEENAERVARLVVGASLTVVAVFLAVQSVRQLAGGTGAGTDAAPILVAAGSVIVLPALARAKRRAGKALRSRALRGDGTLSAIGAAISLIALAGLLVNRTLGWWWADAAAALAVAVVAGAEARVVLMPTP